MVGKRVFQVASSLFVVLFFFSFVSDANADGIEYMNAEDTAIFAKTIVRAGFSPLLYDRLAIDLAGLFVRADLIIGCQSGECEGVADEVRFENAMSMNFVNDCSWGDKNCAFHVGNPLSGAQLKFHYLFTSKGTYYARIEILERWFPWLEFNLSGSEEVSFEVGSYVEEFSATDAVLSTRTNIEAEFTDWVYNLLKSWVFGGLFKADLIIGCQSGECVGVADEVIFEDVIKPELYDLLPEEIDDFIDYCDDDEHKCVFRVGNILSGGDIRLQYPFDEKGTYYTKIEMYRKDLGSGEWILVDATETETFEVKSYVSDLAATDLVVYTKTTITATFVEWVYDLLDSWVVGSLFKADLIIACESGECEGIPEERFEDVVTHDLFGLTVGDYCDDDEHKCVFRVGNPLSGGDLRFIHFFEDKGIYSARIETFRKNIFSTLWELVDTSEKAMFEAGSLVTELRADDTIVYDKTQVRAEFVPFVYNLLKSAAPLTYPMDIEIGCSDGPCNGFSAVTLDDVFDYGDCDDATYTCIFDVGSAASGAHPELEVNFYPAGQYYAAIKIFDPFSNEVDERTTNFHVGEYIENVATKDTSLENEEPITTTITVEFTADGYAGVIGAGKSIDISIAGPSGDEKFEDILSLASSCVEATETCSFDVGEGQPLDYLISKAGQHTVSVEVIDALLGVVDFDAATFDVAGECVEGEIQYHECLEGTQIKWQECVEGVWVIIEEHPENLCPPPQEIRITKVEANDTDITGTTTVVVGLSPDAYSGWVAGELDVKLEIATEQVQGEEKSKTFNVGAAGCSSISVPAVEWICNYEVGDGSELDFVFETTGTYTATAGIYDIAGNGIELLDEKTAHFTVLSESVPIPIPEFPVFFAPLLALIILLILAINRRK